MSESLPSGLKQAVAQRALFVCEYCGVPARYCPAPLSVEHIIPRSKGGTDDDANLALACQGCNNHKYVSTEATDPVTGVVVALFHPRRHRWASHFCWSADRSLILGITPIGRATIEKLRLNRPGLVNLRHVLFGSGAHPASLQSDD